MKLLTSLWLSCLSLFCGKNALSLFIFTGLIGSFNCSNAQDGYYRYSNKECGNEMIDELLGRSGEREDPMDKPLFNNAPIDE